ncbi:MAG TPA: endonuclease [Ohtaekwangia sp.]|nr:endonuclease [Ohtaekwangia sp.]
MEGPSLVILKEELASLKGKKIMQVGGTAKLDFSRLTNAKINQINTWGKHFLLVFSGFTIRIHFLLFGSYRINERKDRAPKLTITCGGKEVNFYSCAVTILEEVPDKIYDWSCDVMSDAWDPTKARKKLKQLPHLNVGDALLDQTIFAGVGNIIKTEVLYRIKVHPDSNIGNLPPRKLGELIKEARLYSFDFLHWKKEFILRKHWLAYKKKICRRCNVAIQLKYTGITKRRSFYCEQCQVLYN